MFRNPLAEEARAEILQSPSLEEGRIIPSRSPEVAAGSAGVESRTAFPRSPGARETETGGPPRSPREEERAAHLRSPLEDERPSRSPGPEGSTGSPRTPGCEGRTGASRSRAEGRTGVSRSPEEGRSGASRSPAEGRTGASRSPAEGRTGASRSPGEGKKRCSQELENMRLQQSQLIQRISGKLTLNKICRKHFRGFVVAHY
jgi:hypothetical protein